MRFPERSFFARGNRDLTPGWKAVYENRTEDEEEEELKKQNLPEVKQGQEFPVSNVRMTEGKTKPPARFTEGTLLSAMENPVKYMESHDKKMAKTLGETGGLGTVATRADIIDKLFSSFLLEKKGERDLHYSQGPPASGNWCRRNLKKTGAYCCVGDEAFPDRERDSSQTGNSWRYPGIRHGTGG